MLLKVPKRKKLVISLTPLIDVVFILLVFFMLASSFLDWREYELSTALTSLNKPAVAASGSAVAQPLRLVINAEGVWSIDGEAVAGRYSAEQMIRERLALDAALKVIIQPEGTLPLQTTIDALDLIKSVGVQAVSLRPRKPVEVTLSPIGGAI